MYSIEQLEARHSVRSYQTEPISTELQRKLQAEVTDINTHGIGLHFQLVFDDGKAFDGFRRSYGMFRNVRNYLAVVADTSFENWEEEAGYYAEQFCIYATSHGLGTCFVGGTYDAKAVNVQMRAAWRLRCVVAFGWPDVAHTSFIGKMAKRTVGATKRPAPEQMFVGEDLPEALRRFPWLEDGLRAVACAPSTLNKRPVRVRLGADSEPELFLVTKDAPGIDFGIARFNFDAVQR